MHVPSLNFELGEEIDLLRESVAAFANHHIARWPRQPITIMCFPRSYGACSASRACSA